MNSAVVRFEGVASNRKYTEPNDTDSLIGKYAFNLKSRRDPALVKRSRVFPLFMAKYRFIYDRGMDDPPRKIPALRFISNYLPRLRENLFVIFLESRRNEFLQFRFKIKENSFRLILKERFVLLLVKAR
ncbi:MAG: hypothetical protein R2682_11890 [Pyrinomonadaceae bacterium]